MIASVAEHTTYPFLNLEAFGLDAPYAISNYPGTHWGTFQCEVVQDVQPETFAKIEEWMTARFLEKENWGVDPVWRNEGDILVDQPWLRTRRNDTLGVRVVLQNWDPHNKEGLHLRIRVRADYFGPPILSGPNNITF